MSSTQMAIDQRFVFSDNMIIRCRFIKNDYIPVEILDLDDILTKIKELLCKRITYRRSESDFTNFEHGSIRDRLLNTRRNSQPNIFKSKSSDHIVSCDSVTNSVVLRMSPMMRENRNSEKRYSTGQIRDEVLKHDKNMNTEDSPLSAGSKTCRGIDTCLNDNPSDYVHIATFKYLKEAELFLLRLKEVKKTLAVEIDVSETKIISISYQQLQNFNQEFMMLDLKTSNHMFFLRPF